MSSRIGQIRALSIARELHENPPVWWNYRDCKACAMEVVRLKEGVEDINMETYFGMSSETAIPIFVDASIKRGIDRSEVTPAMIADDLIDWALHGV